MLREPMEGPAALDRLPSPALRQAMVGALARQHGNAFVQRLLRSPAPANAPVQRIAPNVDDLIFTAMAEITKEGEEDLKAQSGKVKGQTRMKSQLRRLKRKLKGLFG
jgi:hypothetical protein